MLEKAFPESVAVNPQKLFLLLAIIACLFLAACYPVTRSKGVVKDEQGQAIVEATVKIGGKSAKPEALKTKIDGSFDFDTVELISHQHPIEIELTVEKEGFEKFSKPLKFNTDNRDEIVLKRATAG